MGTVIKIPNANFSTVALDTINYMDYEKVILEDHNPRWLPNYNTGAVQQDPSGLEWLWASNPINVEGKHYLWGKSSDQNFTRVMIYSDMPVINTNNNFIVMPGTIDNEFTDLFTISNPFILPSNAKYIVVADWSNNGASYTGEPFYSRCPRTGEIYVM